MEQGKTIGRYEIERVLGEGAMGIVYQAIDPLIGRKVALKTLRTELDDGGEGELHQRFLREAMAAGRLSHPNIITVFDIGQDASGVVFIAMEFVEGKNLEDLLKEGGRMAPERAVEIVTAVADALDYAHREGVVHRDIKPANILLTRSGVPKITDFGIARLEASNLTVQGALLGTPYYMAPEQVLGKKVDGRTDLYALGVILYELLTGTRPFSGQSLMTMIQAILQQPAPDPATLAGDLPPELKEVVDRALAKEPEDRFQTGAEFAVALHGVSDDDEADEDDYVEATCVGVPLPSVRPLRGTLAFVGSERRIHVRSGDELVIGRVPSCSVYLKVPQVSRKHARIHLTGEGVHLSDLGSSNGTVRNGVPVTQPVLLADGDMVGFGGAVHLLVRIRGAVGRPRSVILMADQDEYLLCGTEILIGRDPMMVDIRIADRHAAAVHARISSSVGSPVLQSEEPILVNGRSTTYTQLEDRTSLRIGETEILWLLEELAAGSPAATRY